MGLSPDALLPPTGSLPRAPQPNRRMFPARNFPPEIISQDELPRDIVRVASTRVRVDFENDRTRVLRLSLAVGEATPSHDDRAGVLVCVAGCRIRYAGRQSARCRAESRRDPLAA